MPQIWEDAKNIPVILDAYEIAHLNVSHWYCCCGDRM